MALDHPYSLALYDAAAARTQGERRRCPGGSTLRVDGTVNGEVFTCRFGNVRGELTVHGTEMAGPAEWNLCPGKIKSTASASPYEPRLGCRTH